MFCSFQDFLIELLPEDTRQRFDASLYVSFDRFSRLYGNEPGALDQFPREFDTINVAREACRLPDAVTIPKELAWYIIRSYIKGANRDSYLTPDQYAALPMKDRSVSTDAFRKIFETIWDKWYRKLCDPEDGRIPLWDDQDLVREVLALGVARPRSLCVFCDEAQDFTKIELQFIMRLLYFSQFSLSDDRIRLLPCAFAGDPLQTLNPTGFFWARTESLFHDVVIRPAGANRESLKVHPKVLHRNYRSSLQVVQLCNSIQLWRKILFNYQQISPQSAWSPAEDVQPEYFVIGENADGSEIAERLRDVTVILPCEEGQELASIQKDPYLRALSTNGELRLPANVYSASAAKGLEFNKVVLYCFGSLLDESLSSLWDRVSRHGPVEDFAHQYFFNKLYVAASRARRELYVIDTAEGYQRLWQFIDKEGLKKIYSADPGFQEWQESLGELMRGQDLKVVTIDLEERQEIAEDCAAQGQDTKDPRLLERAASYFQTASPARASRCRAEARELQRRYAEAGDIWFKIGDLDRARRAYWHGCEWGKLVALRAKMPHERGADELEVADLMTTPLLERQSHEHVQRCMEFIHQRISSGRIDAMAPQWRELVRIACERIRAILLRRVQIQPSMLKSWADLLGELDDGGFHGVLEVAGRCYFASTEYAHAAGAWESAGLTNSEEYFVAKGYAVGAPAGIVWWQRANRYDLIVGAWRANGRPVSDEWWRAVAECRERDRPDPDELFDAAIRKQDAETARRVYIERWKQWESRHFSGNAGRYLDLVARRKHWDWWANALPDLFSKGKDIQEAIRLVSEGLRSIAYSELTPADLSTESQSRINSVLEPLVRDREKPLQRHLSPEEIGAALERVGWWNTAVEFYEALLAESHGQLAAFARRRYLILRMKQAAYFRGKGEAERALSMESTARQRADSWRTQVPSPQEMNQFPDLSGQIPVMIRGVQHETTPEGAFKWTCAGNCQFFLERPTNVLRIIDGRSYRQLAELNLEEAGITYAPFGGMTSDQEDEDGRTLFRGGPDGLCLLLQRSSDKLTLQITSTAMDEPVMVTIRREVSFTDSAAGAASTGGSA